MTKKGHQFSGILAIAVAASISYRTPVFHNWFASLPYWQWAAAAFLFFSGSTAPDWLEKAGTRERVMGHRTHTHVLLYWILLIPILWVASLVIMRMAPPPLGEIGSQALFLLIFFAAGGVFHLLLDLGTPSGIPLLHGHQKRVSLRIYRTGALSEGVVLLILGFATVLITAPHWLDWAQQLRIT